MRFRKKIAKKPTFRNDLRGPPDAYCSRSIERPYLMQGKGKGKMSKAIWIGIASGQGLCASFGISSCSPIGVANRQRLMRVRTGIATHRFRRTSPAQKAAYEKTDPLFVPGLCRARRSSVSQSTGK